MTKALFLLAILLPIFGYSLGKEYFITGTNCARFQPLQKIDKLPESEEELQALQCVLTEDKEGYARWSDIQINWKFIEPWSETCFPDDCETEGLKFRTRQCQFGNGTILPASECKVTLKGRKLWK